jgi:hypothetical protein
MQHPGFDGELRPDSFARIDDLVLAYLALIERLNLTNVVVAEWQFAGELRSNHAHNR